MNPSDLESQSAPTNSSTPFAGSLESADQSLYQPPHTGPAPNLSGANTPETKKGISSLVGKRPLILAAVLIFIIVGGASTAFILLRHNPQAKSGLSNQSAQTQPLTNSSPNISSINLNKNTTIADGSQLKATGPVQLQNQINSTNALVVQDASSNNVLVVDTANKKIGINLSPAAGGADLQVAGDISTVGIIINGKLICDASGCLAKDSSSSSATQGPTGPQGPAGPQGPKGDTGATGAQGPSGVATCPYGNCLSLQAATPGTVENGNIDISGTVIAGNFQGDGSGLSNTDSITLQGHDSSYFTDASNITAGALSDSRLSSNVALLSVNNIFTGNNSFSSSILSKNSTDSAAAFQVQNSSGSTVFNVDTSSGHVGINTGAASINNDLQIGDFTSTATTTPDTLSLGATYSSVAGQHAKLKIYDDNGTQTFGLGVSPNSFDFIEPSSSAYNWYQNGTSVMTLDSSANLSVAGTVDSTNGYKIGGTSGASVTCSSGNLLQNATVSSGIFTGGSCVSIGNVTLQNAYDNSGSPATITTSAATKGILFKAGTGNDSTALFSVQNASNVALLTVDAVNGQVTFANATSASTSILIGSGANQANLYSNENVLTTDNGFKTGQMTTTQRDALTSGQRPTGMIIYNTTTNEYEYNAGTEASPNWIPFSQHPPVCTQATWATACDVNNYQGKVAILADTYGGMTFSWTMEYDGTNALGCSGWTSTYKWVPVNCKTPAGYWTHLGINSGASVQVPVAGKWDGYEEVDLLQNSGTQMCFYIGVNTTNTWNSAGEPCGPVGAGGTKFSGAADTQNTVSSAGGTLYAYVGANYTDALDYMPGGSFVVRPVAIQ